MNTKLPILKLKAGLLTVSVWENEENIKSISFQRAYKEKGSEVWKHTQSMNIDDLPKLSLLINEAYKQLVLK